jgi:hypothetical protein
MSIARSTGLACLLVAVMLSCKKEELQYPPRITFVTPTAGSLYQVYDTIPVEALISCEQSITAVRVSLENEDRQPCLTTRYFFPGSLSYKVDFPWPVNDYYIESGNYLVHILAEAGDQSAHAYQPLLIQGTPLSFQKFIILRQAGSQSFDVLSLDQDFNLEYLVSIPGDCIASAVDSRHRLLYVAGKSTMNIDAYNLDDHLPAWSLPVVFIPPMHQPGCLYFDQYLFASYRYDYIRAYDHEGGIVFSGNMNNYDQVPGRIFRHNDLVYVDVQSRSASQQPVIQTYYLVSGVLRSNFLSSGEVLEFFGLDEDEVYILSNETGLATLGIYQEEYNNTYQVFDLPGGVLRAAEQVDAETLILCIDSTLYCYRNNPPGLDVLMNPGIVNKIKYESINTWLALMDSTRLRIYAYPGLGMLSSQEFSDVLLDVQLLYNK